MLNFQSDMISKCWKSFVTTSDLEKVLRKQQKNTGFCALKKCRFKILFTAIQTSLCELSWISKNSLILQDYSLKKKSWIWGNFKIHWKLGFSCKMVLRSQKTKLEIKRSRLQEVLSVLHKISASREKICVFTLILSENEYNFLFFTSLDTAQRALTPKRCNVFFCHRLKTFPEVYPLVQFFS